MFTKEHQPGQPSRTRTESRRRRSGFTLMELMISAGLSSIVLIAILAMILYSARSFAALVNYVDLDNFSRNALDSMTSEIRQADRLLSGNRSSMRFLHSNPTNTGVQWVVDYVYNPDSRTLIRVQGQTREVMLEECDFLEFSFYKRNPATNSFDLYVTATPPVVNPAECKAVQMRWVCSRDIMQEAVNTESVQSARVIIRKK